MNRGKWVVMVICLLLTAGCSEYQYKAIPFRAPGTDSLYVIISGAKISARVWTDRDKAINDFGFDIIRAGLIPIQLVVDNQGQETLVLVHRQTFLIDEDGNYWNILPAGEACGRIDREATPGRVFGSAVRGGALGGAAGAIIGAAVGIAVGQSIGEATGKGAVIGATGGVVIGGREALTDQEAREKIFRDMEERGLPDKPFFPSETSHGFLFFPGEAKAPVLLRLKLKDVTSQTEHMADLVLKKVR